MSAHLQSDNGLTPAQIRQGIVYNVVAGCFGLVFIAAALGFPAALLLESLGASGKQIGMLGSLQHVLLMVQIPAAYLVGHLARRKGFWFATVVTHRMLWCLPGLLPLCFANPGDAIPWILGAVALSTIFDKASSPAWLSWMADLIPDRISGRFWGIRQSIIFVPYLIGTVFYSWCLDYYEADRVTGFAIVFVVAAVFGTVDILVHLGVPEPAPVRHARELGLAARIRAPLRRSDFRWMALAMGLWLFTVGLQQTFAPVYCKQVFHFTYRELAVLALCQNVGVVLAGVLFAHPLDRFGAPVCAFVLLLVTPLANLAWWYQSEVHRLTVLGAMHLLLGGAYSGVLLAHLKMMGTVIPRHDRAMAVAVHWTLVGSLAALGPIAGGWLKDNWSGAGSYFHALTIAHIVLACVVCAFCFRRIQPRGSPSARPIPPPENDPGQVGGF